MNNWRKYNGALVPLTPPHHEVDITDINKRIYKEQVYFARWTSDFDSENETEFWYVICDQKFHISDYSRNTRNQIRRGLRNCKVELINKEIVIKNGFDNYNAAFRTYNTHLRSKNIEEFKEELINLSDEWEFWGIFHKEKMIGYSQNRVIDNYCDYSTIKIYPKYLKMYASYALFYEMNKYYLNEKRLKYVSDGARSISHQSNIQDFLIKKFKFRKAFCQLHLLYQPRIKMIVDLLYPFRNLILNINLNLLQKIGIVLKQEALIREN